MVARESCYVAGTKTLRSTNIQALLSVNVGLDGSAARAAKKRYLRWFDQLHQHENIVT